MRDCQQSRRTRTERSLRLSDVARDCDDWRICAAVDRLFAHEIKQEFSVTELSCQLNLSTSRLRHLFHDKLGISPSQLLKMRRMQKAKALLGSTPMSVKEIMVEVGLNDLSHFVRDFKQVYGTSPSALRKRPPASAAENSELQSGAANRTRHAG
jgi:AraC-like DNA-binding protein